MLLGLAVLLLVAHLESFFFLIHQRGSARLDSARRRKKVVGKQDRVKGKGLIDLLLLVATSDDIYPSSAIFARRFACQLHPYQIKNNHC